MKISVTDKQGSGILRQFAEAIGARVRGRFVHIPEKKGEGYLTGFNWGSDLRMMVRNYYMKEEIVMERTNEIAAGQENVIFFLTGIFAPSAKQEKQLLPEQANVFICMQSVSSVMAMPPDTFFRSVTISVSRQYLQQLFGKITHPIVTSILAYKNNFAFETGISPEIMQTAAELLQQHIPEAIENHYYRLKCEELLCHIFTLLMQREAVPTNKMHIRDIQAIYAIKANLLAHIDKTPDIAALAREAGMSEPKMRKLFKQTFGKGVFEYYQFMRMHEAARLLKEQRLSVSEVGYQLGFTNLSHFSRVFEDHIGVKPKKYSMM